MKTIINIVLLLITIGLIALLGMSINEPIKFNEARDMRDGAVIAKLKKIRDAQQAYRGIKGLYASNFEELVSTLKTDSFSIKRAFGNPDEEGGTFRIETSYVSAADSMVALGINLDSLSYIPYGNGAAFDVKADTITYQQTKVPVVEVRAQIKSYMGEYGDYKYTKYDDRYDPDGYRKFGDLGKPSTSGNWEAK